MSYRKPPIKIALVDDHNLFRKGLITLIKLADKQNYLVVLEAESGKDMMKKIDKKALPDILILDIDMPDMDGFEAMAWLRIHYPQIAVLVVSMITTEEAIVRMMGLGVKGYLSKDIEVEDIHQALQAISSKGHYYTDFITGKLIDSLQNAHSEKNENDEMSENLVWKKLNETERKFIKLACSDMTYEQIADKMFVSPKTVDGYRGAIFNKFGIKNRPGLILFALKNQLFKIDEITSA
ncbi:response regulator transcription factor [Mucilaginibacter sp. OK098]|uniref:response regulator transcription factor n=1 Tax=Mucilaginibacter sp. OK098 TaxID=1855297 RepID=UPI00091EE91E|nr:response regulator transcription factor [Mucilaginibacter sp. OK098]SHM76890.1 two component transcriptional regulator, LuxR family [Mucilaginibacter sp. OK098]